MPRILLIIWLATCNLGYGMAVLAETHADASPDSLSLESDRLVSHSGPHAGDEAECDHSCHGLTHLMGLLHEKFLVFSMNRGNCRVSYQAHCSSPPAIRLFRPPRSA